MTTPKNPPATPSPAAVAVPREPTPEMIKAMERAIMAYLKDHEDWAPVDKAAWALYRIAKRLRRSK